MEKIYDTNRTDKLLSYQLKTIKEKINNLENKDNKFLSYQLKTIQNINNSVSSLSKNITDKINMLETQLLFQSKLINFIITQQKEIENLKSLLSNKSAYRNEYYS